MLRFLARVAQDIAQLLQSSTLWTVTVVPVHQICDLWTLYGLIQGAVKARLGRGSPRAPFPRRKSHTRRHALQEGCRKARPVLDPA